MTYWVYILAGGRHGTVYVGVTNSLERRIAQHKAREVPGFTATYGVDRLVWFQGFGDVGDAIYLEKRLKRWRREWKVRLIERDNPDWRDLYPSMMATSPDRSASMGPGQALRAFRDDTPLYSRTAGPRRGRLVDVGKGQKKRSVSDTGGCAAAASATDTLPIPNG